ncbi:unnamed protein product [Rotaria sp. Silwood2]|nr:unnamed protein product [Rotaria sp. Silwood2]CAF2988192.1 unnamed protein product [Rotaria sp. Silwood2]CAF4122275.1 unnamed protein product [Rotaria sp. Silwood2]
MTKETTQRIIRVDQGQIVKIHTRQLQSVIVETIELNLQKHNFINSRKLGFRINGGIGKNNNNDLDLFVIGIKTKSPTPNKGRLQIGDR